MRTFSLSSLALLVCISAAGCANSPAAPSTLTTLSSTGEGFTGSVSTPTPFAMVKPSGKPVHLNLKSSISAVDAVAKTITVSSRIIVVPDAARIVDALEVPLTFVDLTVGKTVHITATSVGTITTASIVRVDVPAPKPPKNVRLKGAISLATGTCATKTFTVAGREVRSDASTAFIGSGRCAAIADGKTVDVTGVEMTDYVQAIRVNVAKK